MMSRSDESLDAFFDGRITLYQSRAGYRFSLDALLLAHFVTAKTGARVVDLGTGNGRHSARRSRRSTHRSK
jgi:tRNA1(Val) A37 N6-methylase TrmN6